MPMAVLKPCASGVRGVTDSSRLAGVNWISAREGAMLERPAVWPLFAIPRCHEVVWGVLGMNIRHNRRAQLAVAAQLLLGIAGLAIITFVCFRLGFGLARTGFAYVILIALVSVLGSFSISVVLSIIAAACLNYFFAPPLFELRIDAVDDIVRIAAFLATSLVVTALTSKRKRTEQEMRESKARLEEAQHIAHFGWWERDLSSSHVTLSDEVCRIFGLQPVDLPEWHGRWLELIHPDDRTRVDEAAAAAVRRGGPRYDVEYRVVRPDGTVRVVHSRGDVTWNGAATPVRQFGVLQDITELRGAEQELRASEARFRTFVDYATDAFFVLDDDATVLDVNRQACNDLGYTKQELIGKHRSAFDIGLDDASVQSLKQRIAAGDSLTFETRHRRKDGTSFPVELRVAQFEQGGRRFLCLARDITERKKAEEALRRSEAYLAEAQRLSHSGAFAYNETRFLYWSEELYRIYGFAPLQGIPTREAWWQQIHPDDRDRVYEEIQEALREKKDYAVEFRIVLPDGTLKHIQSNGHPSFAAGGELVEVIGTSVDMTERTRAQEEHERLRQLEADLAHMNRLGIMGELTASLAHELLHPIATARNNARAGMRFLETSPPNLDEVREALGCVVKDVDRAKDLVARIRDHIKKAPPRNEVFDLNGAIEEVILMVRTATARNGVSVRTSLMERIASVRGDRVQLQQVVLNLILNAVEAMGSVEEGARQLSISTELSQAVGILVAVRDSGPGIDPEHLDGVFKPFYTTKASGIGMGLSICRSIIDAHGGQLWAEANQPRGAAFKFNMPSAQDSS
jgi:PAS domain S-box-containing protein